MNLSNNHKKLTQYSALLASFFIAAFVVVNVFDIGLNKTSDKELKDLNVQKENNANIIDKELGVEDDSESAVLENEPELTESTEIQEVLTDPEVATEESMPDDIVINSTSVIDCVDCTLAPVDKDNQLPPSYNPNGILPIVQNDFSALVNDAASKGLNIEVISGFRSFASQASTFQYWVNQEIAKGKTLYQADLDANVYSARPGHSEHQLGTTYDVKCVDCIAFDAASNELLYKYIGDNAHRFGFVVSYPVNSEHLTGYTYEPWHIRWIGLESATELYNTGYISGNGNYLTKFLTDKGY